MITNNIDDGENEVEYPRLQRRTTTKILGLHITSHSFTAQHVIKSSERANLILKEMQYLRHLSVHAKTQLVKSLILTILTYPCAPLNTCSVSRLYQLQTVQNNCLRWIYNIRQREHRITNRALHERAKLPPINQVIHSRARTIWQKLRAGEAGDLESFREISDIEFTNYYIHFPSSYIISLKEDPPPIYNTDDCKSPAVKAFYAHSPDDLDIIEEIDSDSDPDEPDDPP